MDIALIDPIELRPHDDRIAPLSDEHLDGDNTLGLIRQTDVHVTLHHQLSIPPNSRAVEDPLSTQEQPQLYGGGGATAPGATEPISQSRNSAIFGASAVASGATM